VVREKIVSCAAPDYENGYPPAIGYAVCKRVSTPACPLRLDGSPNGFELTKGASCDGPNITTRCGDYSESPQPSMHMPSYLDYLDWTLETRRGDPGCPDKGSPDKQIGYTLKHQTTAPFCIGYNYYRLMENAAINFFKLKHNYPAYHFAHFNAVIRRFHDSSCPDFRGDQLNAVVIKQFPLLERGKKIFMCDITFKDMRPLNTADDVNVYLSALLPQKDFEKVVGIERIHDDRCGLEPEVNALKLELGW
jgi:hypothetical protein